MRILITGGAGFMGSNLALAFREKESGTSITAFDNLKRRGSELNLPRLKRAGVDFVHGDIRNPDDLAALDGRYDLFIEASAEPSVLAGVQPGSDPAYALHANLTGTVHCLEWARKRGVGRMMFLSTSRIFSIAALKAIALKETSTRLDFDAGARPQEGVSAEGVNEDFSKAGARSLYGTTKLASELLVEEYAQTFNIPALVNRCSVLCGPWQMGKVDQGVFTLWVARHAYHTAEKPSTLSYTGFGGKGHQVRDLLHPLDLFALLEKQMRSSIPWDGRAYNVGGGAKNAISLRELTALCEEATGNRIKIGSQASTASVDVPWFVADSRRVQKDFGWSPQRSVPQIVIELATWLKEHRSSLAPLFGS